jgi:hypothetical protein
VLCLQKLNVPSLTSIDTGIMDKIRNSVMPQVNATLQNFDAAYFNDIKTALSVT